MFNADTLCYVVTFTFDPSTLNICSTSDVMWTKSVYTKFEPNPTIPGWVSYW